MKLNILASGILSVLAGIAAWKINSPIVLETYKILLSFTLVGIIGVAIKAAVDARNRFRERIPEALRGDTEGIGSPL